MMVFHVKFMCLIANEIADMVLDFDREKTSPTRQRCVRTVSLCVLTLALESTRYVTYLEIQMDRQMDRQMKRESSGGSQNTFVDH